MPCHRKYSQSPENRKAVEYSTMLHLAFPLWAELIGLAAVFSTAWYKIVMQHYLVGYVEHPTCHLYFLGMQTRLKTCV